MTARSVATPPRPSRTLAVWSLTFALLAAASLATPAPAQEPGAEPRLRLRHGPLDNPDELADRLDRQLDLSEEQLARLRELAERFRAENDDLLERLEDLREELREQAQDGGRPGPERRRELSERFGDPMRDLRPRLRELRDDVMELLTPEQRERWKGHPRERMDGGKG